MTNQTTDLHQALLRNPRHKEWLKVPFDGTHILKLQPDDRWQFARHGVEIRNVGRDFGDDCRYAAIFSDVDTEEFPNVLVGIMFFYPRANTKSDRLLNVMRGLSAVFAEMDRRELAGKPNPTLLFASEVLPTEAILAHDKLGFYAYEESFWTEGYDMLASVHTVREKFDALKNKWLRGKTLFERLEERSKNT